VLTVWMFPWAMPRPCVRSKPQAILANCYRKASEDRWTVGEGGYGSEYQFQLPRVGFVPQILPQVEAVHIHVDETERVCLSRVHSQERCYVHVSVVKESPYVNFVAKPL